MGLGIRRHERTPKELKEYRNDIAHWHTGRIEGAYLSDLQRTALELLRRKYRPTKDGEVGPIRKAPPSATRIGSKV